MKRKAWRGHGLARGPQGHGLACGPLPGPQGPGAACGRRASAGAQRRRTGALVLYTRYCPKMP